MIKRNLKLYAVPIIYVLALFIFGTSLYLVQRIVNNNRFHSPEIMEYVDSEIVTDNEYIPVINEIPSVMKPFLNSEVKINKTFYDREADPKDQESSLIFYEDTYMQNTGVDYKHTEAFEIIAILDGTVIEVGENEILGKEIKIKHNNDIISTYQCLSEIKVNKDETVLRGQIIGKSGTCKLYSTDSNIHFELSKQGKNIDPEKSYNKTEDEL